MDWAAALGFAIILAWEGKSLWNIKPGYLVALEAGGVWKERINPDFCVSFEGLGVV